MAKANVNICGKYKIFHCCGDCIYPVSEEDECKPPQDDTTFHESFESMIEEGWGLVKNICTANRWWYMCPKCFMKYGDK